MSSEQEVVGSNPTGCTNPIFILCYTGTMNKHKFRWLFGALVLTAVFGTIYKVGQISLESTLYDPLTYEAVDKAWATAITAEKDGRLKAPFSSQVDVEKTQSSFLTVYNKDKKVVGSSGVLDENTPQLPSEFLDNTNPFVRNYFSWEPKPGVHLAGVTVSAGNYGYVLAGRSMSETDRHLDRLTKTVIVGWLASLILLGVSLVIDRKKG